MENKFDPEASGLKKAMQEVIDLIATKQYQSAIEKLAEASNLLDDILDHSDDDEDLIELSRYQVLMNQLQQKIYNA